MKSIEKIIYQSRQAIFRQKTKKSVSIAKETHLLAGNHSALFKGYKGYLFLFFLLLSNTFSHAQLEAANWYFGEYAGLDFNSATPTALTNGQLDHREGTSAISDEDGNLLFYTDGIDVYDATHNIMPNGTGLLGHDSSSQTLIVPDPGDSDRYYVFTTDETEYYPENIDGLNYSVVDITLNGGLGDVIATEKNILLESSANERVTAVFHANNADVWVISHRTAVTGSNEYVAYLITSSGINTTPVVSAVGKNHFFRYTGQLKASPDGTKLACTIGDYNYNVEEDENNAGLELFDFDNTTGMVSNAQEINTYPYTYGVEFSPNSNVLYADRPEDLETTWPIGTSFILQYDISLPTLAEIQSSETVIDSAPHHNNGRSLQLGIDGKIYTAQIKTLTPPYNLSVINNPNVVGLGCNFYSDVVSLATGKSLLGLPNFITSYFQFGIAHEGICSKQPTMFEIKSHVVIDTATWNFGDGQTGTGIAPYHIYDQPGTYTVTAVAFTQSGTPINLEGEVTIVQGAEAIEPEPLVACDNGENNIIIDLTQQNETILNGQDLDIYTINYFTDLSDAENNTDPIDIPDDYTYTASNNVIYVRVTNTETGCYALTEFPVETVPTPTAPEVPDIEICDTGALDGMTTIDLTQQAEALQDGQPNTELSYFETQQDAENNTNTIIEPGAYSNTNNPQTIYVRIANADFSACYATTQFEIEVLPAPELPNDLELVACPPVDLTVIAADFPDLTIGYYATQADAESGENPLSNGTEYPLDTMEGTVYIVAEDTEGCVSAVAELSLVRENCIIPQAFSPNGDGLNDSFDLSNWEVQELEVYNRNGIKVYTKTGGYANEWVGQTDKGNELPVGTYFYVMRYQGSKERASWVYLNK